MLRSSIARQLHRSFSTLPPELLGSSYSPVKPETPSFPVHNPATGDCLGFVTEMTEADATRAIAKSREAFDSWKSRSPRDRALVIRKWAELMQSNKQDLASIMTLEQGKPLAEAVGEINYASSFFEWFSEEAPRILGDYIPPPSSNTRIFTQRSPVGVVAAVTPWNFPAAMITRKAGAALAAGCTMVVKPSEFTPLSCLALLELGKRAGLPDGCVTAVTGSFLTGPECIPSHEYSSIISHHS